MAIRADTFWHRLPLEQRAGTRIDHQNAIRVYTTIKDRRVLHGLLDTRQRVYQCGGELKNFVFWKLKLVSLPLDVWDQIKARSEWIEVIDHEQNRCYRASMLVCHLDGQLYREKIEPRFGLALSAWKVTDGPVTPDRPEPAVSVTAPTVPAAR